MALRLPRIIDILRISQYDEMETRIRSWIQLAGKRPIYIFLANPGKVVLKTRWENAENDPDWDGEDWEGDDDSCMFIFDRREYNKQQRRLTHALPPNQEVPVQLRNGNKFFHPFIDWDALAATASELMKTFRGPTELHLNHNYTYEFVRHFRDIQHNGHCEILELNYEGATSDHLDSLLLQFDTVSTVLLGDSFDGDLQHHSIFNYNTIIINNAEDIQRGELLHLSCKAIELINPNNLMDEDIAEFIKKWKDQSDSDFGMLKLEFLDGENHFDLEEISSELQPMPYEEGRRYELGQRLDSDRIATYSFLFEKEDGIDFMRRDGLTATLVNHRSSTYFVVWHT